MECNLNHLLEMLSEADEIIRQYAPGFTAWIENSQKINPIEFKYAIVTSVVNAVDEAFRDGETDYETLSDIIHEAIG